MSMDAILRHFNDSNINYITPVVVVLAIVMLLGIMGNCLVLYIYVTKLKPNTIKCFIIGLTLLDLAICLFDIPLTITDLRYQYTFGSYTIMCKAAHGLHDFLFISAIFLMIAVAVERYKKVCTPLKKQMSVLTGKITTGVCCGLGMGLCIPACFIYGEHIVPLQNSVINGTLCARSAGYNPTLLLIYYGFWMGLDVVCLLTLIILYCLIWYRVFSHLKSRRRKETFRFIEIETDFSSEFNQRKRIPIESSEMDLSQLEPRFSDQDNTEPREFVDPKDNRKESMSISDREPTAWDLGKVKSRKLGVSRMTRTMFWVTLIYIAVLLPAIFKMVIELYSDDAFQAFQKNLSWFYEIFMRTYYLQCAANPLLYSYFNTRFQYELKKLLNQFRHIVRV